ncbi:major facilitator superfamily domain-containing protein [Melanogaster broomeanus]|nr:major facilitator superfamily domain-containing protein [Melanogaster broomeanus]
MRPEFKLGSDTFPQDDLESRVLPQKKETGASSDEQLDSSVARIFTAQQEAKLYRKIDLDAHANYNLDVLALLHGPECSIGNATVEGMMTQLDLTGNRYNMALTMFFIASHFSFRPFTSLTGVFFRLIVFLRSHQSKCSPYTSFGSSNPDTRWLPAIMVAWGIVMMAMGFVKTYPQLVGARVCLGVAEAGLYPGVAYYLTFWYPKYKYQYRIAMFSGAASMAGAFSGLLAFAIGSMNGVGGLEAWSWIFIINGLATIVVGLSAAFIMADYPDTAKFLTTAERSFVIEKRKGDSGHDEEGDAAQQVWAAFTDWQVWALSAVIFSITAPSYGLVYFLPLIINGPSITQLLSIPISVVATISMLITAHYSDKVKLRSPFIFGAQSVALVGYVISISDAPPGIKYFAFYLCFIGTSAIPGSY